MIPEPMDSIRPMLMPVLLVLIVSTIWVMGWMKQMDVKSSRRPSRRRGRCTSPKSDSLTTSS